MAIYRFHGTKIFSLHGERQYALLVLDEKRGPEYAHHEIVALYDHSPVQCAQELADALAQGRPSAHGDILKRIVIGWDADQMQEFIQGLRDARHALGFTLADSQRDRDEDRLTRAEGRPQDAPPTLDTTKE